MSKVSRKKRKAQQRKERELLGRNFIISNRDSKHAFVRFCKTHTIHGKPRIRTSNATYLKANMSDAKNTPELKRAQLVSLMQAEEKVPDNFGDALKFFMDKVGFTVDDLSALTGISTKQISRWRNSPAPRPSVENVMLLCVSMHLARRYSDKLMSLAGIVLRDSSPLERAYDYILDSDVKSVKQCNDVLGEMGFKPLTNNIDIVDEENL